MIGTKEIKMVTTGKKLVDKYKSNFSAFAKNEFCVRIALVDENSNKRKIKEFIVNAENWMDYLENGVDFGDYKIYRIEAFIPNQKEREEMGL